MTRQRAVAVSFLFLGTACRQNAPTGQPEAAVADVTGGVTGGLPEMVYQRAPARPMPLEADDTHLYWGEGGAVFRMMKAPKSGAGPAEEVGPWTGLEVMKQVIVVDATTIYWLDDGVIRRREKSGATPPPLDIGKPSLAGGWVMVGDEDGLYFADRDCLTVGRVPKAGGQRTSYVVKDHQGAGGAWLAVDGDSLYCGSGTDLLRMPKQGGEATKLAIVAAGERVGPLVPDLTNVYWANNRAVLATRQENLASIAKAGGAITNLGVVGTGSAILRMDVARNALYWTTRAASNNDKVMSYSIADRKLTTMAMELPVFGGMAHDERYVYWAGETAIMRLAK